MVPLHRVRSLYPIFVLSRYLLPPSLALSAYIYSLDGTTTYNYLAFATSSFGHHSLISTIQVAQSIISKPPVVQVLFL